MNQNEVKKSLHELKVNELRSELEKRGMEKAGIKAILIDRLDQALKAEGHDMQTYRFSMAEVQTSSQQSDGGKADSVQLEEMSSEAKQNENAVVNAVVELGENGEEKSMTDNCTGSMTTAAGINETADQQQEIAPVGQRPKEDNGPVISADTLGQQRQPMETNATAHDGPNAESATLVFAGKNGGDTTTNASSSVSAVEQPSSSVPAVCTTGDAQQQLPTNNVPKNDGAGNGHDENAAQMDQEEPDIIIEMPNKSIKSECVEEIMLVSPTACASAVGGSAAGGGVGTKLTKEVVTVAATATAPTSLLATNQRQLNAVTPNGTASATATTTMAPITTTTTVTAAVTSNNTAVANDANTAVTTVSSSSEDVILLSGNQQQQQGKVKETSRDDATAGQQQSGTPSATTAQLVNGNNLSSSLWIRNITTTTKAADLKALFSKHGKVITAKIFTTKNKQSPTCFGYVTLADAETANVCAHKLNRSNFKGRIINVEKADRSNLSQIGTQPQQATAGNGTAKADANAKHSGTGGTKGAGSSASKSGTSTEPSASSSSSKKVRPRITAVTESPSQRHRSSKAATAAAASSSSRTSIRKRIAKSGAGTGAGGATSKYDSLSRNQRRYFRNRVAASFGQRGVDMDSAATPQYIVKSRSAAEPRHIYSRVVHQTSRGIRVLSTGAHQYGGAQQYAASSGGGFRDFSVRHGGVTGGLADSRRFGGSVNDEREEMFRLMEQREEEHRKKEDELRLEREREKLKYEREKLERERLEVEHMKLAAQIQASGWLQAAALPAAGGFVTTPHGGAAATGFVGPNAAGSAMGGGGMRPQQNAGGGGLRSQQNAAGGDTRQRNSRHHSVAAAPLAKRSSAKMKEPSSSSSKLAISSAGRTSVVGRAKESSGSSRSHHDTRRASSDRDRAAASHHRSRSPIRRSSTRSDKNITGSSSSTYTWQSKGSSVSRYGGKQRDSGGGGGRGRSASRGRGGMSSSSSHHQPSYEQQQQLGAVGGSALTSFSQPQPFGGGGGGNSSSTGALSYDKQQQYSFGGGGGGTSSRMTSSSSAAVSGGGYDRHGQLQGRSYFNDRYTDTQPANVYASRTDPSYGQRIGQQFSNSSMGGGGSTREEQLYTIGSGGGGGSTFGDSGYASASAPYGGNSSRGQSSGGGQPSSSSYYNSQSSSAWGSSAGAGRATEMVNSRAFGTGASGGTSSATGGGWSRQTDDILSEWNMYGSPSKMTGTASSSSGRYHQQQSMSYGGAGRSGGGAGGSLYSGGGGRRY